jgi:hypothetical protein
METKMLALVLLISIAEITKLFLLYNNFQKQGRKCVAKETKGMQKKEG